MKNQFAEFITSCRRAIRRAAAICGALAILAALSACGGKSPSLTTAPAPPPEAAAAPTPAPTPAPPTLQDQLMVIDAMSREGRHADALATLEPLIAAHPETQRPRGLKTDILLRKGDYQDALALQREIIAAIPDKWYAQFHLGLIYLEYLHQFPEAIAAMDEALALLKAGAEEYEPAELTENTCKIHMSLAKASDKAGDHARALAECAVILELRPGDPWAATFQTMVKEKAGLGEEGAKEGKDEVEANTSGDNDNDKDKDKTE